MKKTYKILAVILALLIVAVVGFTLFAKSYLTDERIRTLVTESAEKSLRRKVSLGAISVSIFSGISVKDFAILEKDSDQTFLKADAFVLKYQFLPLLSKRLIIDELAVESPRILITKKADGSFNFSDMTKPKEETVGEKKVEVSGLPVSLSVKSLRIEKARLEYDDPGGTVRRAVIDLEADIALHAVSNKVIDSTGKSKVNLVEVHLKGRPKPVKDLPISVQYQSKMNLADRKIDISEASIAGLGMDALLRGQVNYGGPLSYTVTVKASQVNLSAVQKSAAGFLPGEVSLDGGLSVDLTAEQKPIKEAKPTFKGEIVLRNVAVQTKSMRPVLNGAIVLSPDRIDFRALKLVAGGSTADITGHVLNYATSPDLSKQGLVYSITAEASGVKLEEITAAFAPKAKEKLFGSLSARAEISGSGSMAASMKRNLKGKGFFSVKDGKIRNAQISEGLLTILGLKSLKEIPIEKAEGSFTIGGGTINLKSLVANRDLVVNESGTIDLDQRLDMSLLVKVSDALSPKIVSQSGVSRFLSVEKGWTTVPLKLGGTISRPAYGIDTTAVGKQATQKMQKKMGEELLKSLSGEKETKPDEQPADTQKKKKGGSPKDLLKGLFK